MKKLVLLFTIFICLAAFVYFYEFVGGEDREKARELEESLFQLTEEQITSLEILQPGKDRVDFVKEAGVWRLRAPIEAATDRFAVESLLSSLAGAGRDRTLEGVEDVGQYGLENPRMTLVLGSEEDSRRLKIGLQDFSGLKVYAQFEPGDDVFLTSESLFSAADKDIFEWRDKSVLDFEEDLIQEVEIIRPSETVRLEKVESRWLLESPLEDDADAGNVSSLLSSVQLARVERFEAGTPEDLKEYGLDEPSVVFRVREQGKDQWLALELGAAGEGGLYARNPDREPVFVVKDSLLEKLSEDVWLLRNKKVVNTEQDRVKRFVLRQGEVEIAMSRQEYDWVIESPEEQSGKKSALYKFWYPVTDVEFSTIEQGRSVEGDSRFLEPDMVLELELEDGQSDFFDFATLEGVHYARRRASGKWGEVSADSFEKLRLIPADLVTE